MSDMNEEQLSAGRVAPALNGPWWERANGLWQRMNVRAVRVVGGTLLSVLFSWLAVRQVPLDQVAASFADIRYGFLALALAPVLISPLARAIRWRLLYHPRQDGLRLPSMAVILLISQMLNIVLPARGGEVARIVFMARTADRSPAYTLGTIVVEKWLDIVVLLVLVLLVPLFVALPPWFQDSRIALAVFAVAFFGGALVLTYGRERLLSLAASLARFFPARWRRPVKDTLETGLLSLDVLRSPRVGFQLQAWSLLLCILSILVNYVTLLALGISLPLAAALFVLVVLQIGVAVPSTPGKVGVFHYLCVLALSVFGVDKTTALSYGILLYFVVFLPPTLLGGLGLWWYTVRRGGLTTGQLSPGRG